MADATFRTVKEIVEPDSRGRLSLGTIAKGKRYSVQVNDAGQILLDLIVTIPEREVWLWQNSGAIAAVQRGIQQVGTGDLHDLGSSAQYADLEIDDG